MSEFLCVCSTEFCTGLCNFSSHVFGATEQPEAISQSAPSKNPDCRNTLTFTNQSQLALNSKDFCQHLYQITQYICLYLVCLSCLPSLVFLTLIMHTCNFLEVEP